MDELLQKELIALIKSIKNQIPEEISLYNVESKLDKLIELQEKQNEFFEELLEKLDSIYQDMPTDTVSLSSAESTLDNLVDEVKETNSLLKDVVAEVSNLPHD